ncbi:hypothetical protein LIS82_07840 [Cytobacillus solani]|uniref:hypothetical protein n=1 Tax=Cytobacillus solani TaxID=1637975 RepID=UPI002079F3FD|nr:hypothetical protein [Cytobacillus solani]USK56372.1 hypothetical protein LIS82_07840 [Cytobacillus solani]
MPAFQSFLSGNNLVAFWDSVKWLLFFVAPVIMIFFGLDALKLLIRVIRGSVTEEGNKDNDDDDYDVYRY